MAAASVMTIEAASMTGVRTEGTAGATVLVLSKKRSVAASETVAGMITVSSHSVGHWCVVSKFASKIIAGLPCAGMAVHMAPKESLKRVLLQLSLAVQ